MRLPTPPRSAWIRTAVVAGWIGPAVVSSVGCSIEDGRLPVSEAAAVEAAQFSPAADPSPARSGPSGSDSRLLAYQEVPLSPDRPRAAFTQNRYAGGGGSANLTPQSFYYGPGTAQVYPSPAYPGGGSVNVPQVRAVGSYGPTGTYGTPGSMPDPARAARLAELERRAAELGKQIQALLPAIRGTKLAPK